MSAPPPSVLYLSHDGILEPLGESQVLAYLEGLSRAGAARFTLISFEKTADRCDRSRWREMERRLAGEGIRWLPLAYHRFPPLLSTLWDLLRAYRQALRWHRREHFRLVHARSYPMCLLALALKRRLGVPFLFDMRGFWADERVESGGWRRNGLLYRLFKRAERLFLLEAAAVVSLTAAAVRVLEGLPFLRDRKPRFRVIPTCADLSVFQGQDAPPPGPPLLGYVGSTSLWYDFAPVARIFRELRGRHPGARLLVLTRDPEAPLRALLGGIPEEAIEIRRASRSETAAAMGRMHFTAFFLRPSFAKTASMPTKLGEFLASGVPCLTNTGCGDLEDFFRRPGIGVAVRDPADPQEMSRALDRVLHLASDPEARSSCRRVAAEELDLSIGVRRYAELYREVLAE